MRIDIISVVPQLMESPFAGSIMSRAIKKGLCEVHFHDLKAFSSNNYGSVDDYQYGGGAGMVLTCEPLAECIDALLKERSYDEIIYLTPDGTTLKQGICNTLSLCENLLLICGHYKGIDQRIREEYVTKEISIGDYVLSGGELGAVVLCDAVIRLIPGVIGDETSALTDSFQDNLLAPPVYTRPPVWRNREVPEVLLSGDFKRIEAWRMEQAEARTREIRPDLLENEK